MRTAFTVLYVTALAGGAGCGAFLRLVRLRHHDPVAPSGPAPWHPEARP